MTELCTMTIYNYAQLGKEEKEELLRNKALLMEHYTDGQATVYVYFLDGFFVEVRLRDGKITENIPYKRGYRIDKTDVNCERNQNNCRLAA